MTVIQTAEDLEREMSEAPERFDEEGKAYALLQHYFAGRSLEHLRPHLRSDHPLVKRSVLFVVSELGRQAAPLASDVAPLARDGDRIVRYLAIESIAVCAVDGAAVLILEISRALEDADPVISRLAMRLLARIDTTRLETSYHYLREQGGLSEAHLAGLGLLIVQDASASTLEAMLSSSSNLVSRRYAAVKVARSRSQVPAVARALAQSENEELRKFAHEMRIS